MTFPNAYDGVKKIYLAEILTLIAEVLLLISTVGILAAAQTDEATVGMVSLIFGTISIVALFVAFILNLMGITRAMKDEPSFKLALIFTIVSIVTSGVSAVLAEGSLVSDILEIVSNASSIIITLLIIQGIANLALKLRDLNMAEQGKKLMLMILTVQVLSVAAKMIAAIFESKGGLMTSGIIALVASVIAIVGYVIYLIYLSRAKKMLASS